MQTKEYRTVDKSGWGGGPWDDEPDKVQWPDAATGLPCLAVRAHRGHWCGYVGVPPEHRLHGKGFSGVDLPVHGGLNFAAGCGHPDDESRGVCHVPGAGEPDDVWWFGFDCAHLYDLMPGMRALACMESFQLLFADSTYRPLAYVQAECADLAAELARVK